MNLAEQFKNVNWKDIGNAPALPKLLAMVLLLLLVVAAGWYGYWTGLSEVQVGQFVATLEKQLPSKSEMDALLTDINQSGLGRGLQFELFKPGGVSVKEYYAELPIAVKVTGTYHDMGAFASDIAQLSRIVTLNDMVITTAGAGLTMDTTAKTFRYLDGGEVAAQRKAAPKGGAKK
jgi:type IV pilus assembly protein PilO